MKILFICNSLEDGKDGIGDYTKRIALECTAYNISAIIIAFNDRYISDVQSGHFNEEVRFYRIPEKLSVSDKETEFKTIVQQNGTIDWVSLQFVSYGLNQRGILWAEIQPFRRMLGKFKVHVMVHELWVAEEREASFKMKLLGYVQKRFILSFLKAIKPKVINCSIPLYKKMLAEAGIKSSILPLFSNINHHFTKLEDFKKNVPVAIYSNRNHYLIGCLFGSIYNYSWDLSSLFEVLEQNGKESGKKIIIVSLGKIGYGKEFWEALPSKYKEIEFLTLGQQDERFISYWLSHFVDFGIITTPAIIAGKSGSYMAFLEHGIPVLCKRNELSFNFDISEELMDEKIIQIDGNFDFESLSPIPFKSQIKNTIQKFIGTLKES